MPPISQNLFNKSGECDGIVLSPRFYGSALLITRLFSQIWEERVFVFKRASKTEKMDAFGISITRPQVEYYLSSISVLADFFNIHRPSFVSFVPPKGSNAITASDAESIAMNALILLINSIKDALSLINVFYEDIDAFKSLLNTLMGAGEFMTPRHVSIFLILSSMICLPLTQNQTINKRDFNRSCKR